MKPALPNESQPSPVEPSNTGLFDQDLSAAVVPADQDGSTDRFAFIYDPPKTDVGPANQPAATYQMPSAPQLSGISHDTVVGPRVIPPEVSHPRKAGRLLAGVLALGLAATATVMSLRSGHEGQPDVTLQRAPVAAADRPTTTLATTSTTQETSTTVKDVVLSPANTAPSTAVTIKQPAAVNQAPTSSSSVPKVTKEVTAPEKRLLADEEVQKMITATKYEGLAGHTFEVAEEFNTGVARYVVINLDGSKSAVPISELKADIALAETDAAARPSFSTKVQLGPGVSRQITFQARPAKLTPDGTDTRYIIYTNSALASLTGPSFKDFQDSSTISMPYKHMNVTLIRNHSAKEKVDGMPANSFYTGAEARQTATGFDLSADSEHDIDQTKPDMSFVTSSTDPLQRKADLVNLGREIYINSLSYAQESARAGIPYAQYKEQALRIPLRAYAPQASVFYMAVSEAQYNSLG